LVRALSTVRHSINQSDDARYFTAGQIRERFGVSDMWIFRRLKDGGFPQPVRFGPGKSSPRFWKRSDIEEWERAKLAAAKS
jgi:predicted DNA-binding transcriptional regulator AlpA